MSLDLGFLASALALAVAYTLRAATVVDSWVIEDDASDLEDAPSQVNCTPSPQERTQLKTPPSLAVKARAPRTAAGGELRQDNEHQSAARETTKG